MKRQKKNINGWVNFYKPVSMTSTQAVGLLRRVTGASKIGHGGTLDPLAEGVLPIALGEATKTVNFTMAAEKVYEFTVQFGSATSTDDAEGEVTRTSDAAPTQGEIEAALPQFVGHISQLPPQFSALKIGGQAAYQIARKGQEAPLQPRPVWVKSLELIGFETEGPRTATCVAVTGKGVYVRSLARDLGETLGCFGHIIRLKRVRVGTFLAQNALSIEKCEEILAQMPEMGHDAQAFLSADGFLRPVDEMLDDIPAYAATHREVRDIHFGTKLERVHLKPGTIMKMMTPDGQLASIFEVGADNRLNIIRNFNVVGLD